MEEKGQDSPNERVERLAPKKEANDPRKKIVFLRQINLYDPNCIQKLKSNSIRPSANE